jgi:hypothetical protein
VPLTWACLAPALPCASHTGLASWVGADLVAGLWLGCVQENRAAPRRGSILTEAELEAEVKRLLGKGDEKL